MELHAEALVHQPRHAPAVVVLFDPLEPALRRPDLHSGATPRFLHIFLASLSGISVWRGTVATRTSSPDWTKWPRSAADRRTLLTRPVRGQHIRCRSAV